MIEGLTYADIVRNNPAATDDDSVHGEPSDNSCGNESVFDGGSDSGNGSAVGPDTENGEKVEILTGLVGKMSIEWRSYKTPSSVSFNQIMVSLYPTYFLVFATATTILDG